MKRTFALFIAALAVLGSSGYAQAQQLVRGPRVALTSPTTATSVQRIYGPVHYGAEFGLEVQPDDFTVFESHTTATQSVLAGEADIVGGSFTSTLLVRQAGQDFRVFCPNVGVLDYVLVGRNGINQIEQLLDANTRVGVNSAGSGGDAVLNSFLQAYNVDATAETLPNTLELGSSSLRLEAFSTDQVDATVLQLNQFRQVEEDIADSVIIAKLYETVPLYVHTAYSAPATWLEANQQTAAAFCAASLKAAGALSADFDLYYTAVQELMKKPPAQDEVKEVWEMVSQYDFWMQKSGISADAVTFMATVAQNAGYLDALPDPAEVLDTATYEMALELLKTDASSGTPQP
jgi:ABC-type nitrate/sulfonate/bicarbonate transport system substrate-binding protein